MTNLPQALRLRCPVCAESVWLPQDVHYVCRRCGARCALLAERLVMEWLPAEGLLAGAEDGKVRPSNSYQGEAGGAGNRALCALLHRPERTPAGGEPL